jgi:hypothetical protein
MIGCSTRAHVNIDRVSTENVVFIVAHGDDLGVGLVISEELSKRGYKVYAFNPPKKTFSQRSASSMPKRSIFIEFNYKYNWDLFHYTLSSFSMRWVDGDSGETIAHGNFSGVSNPDGKAKAGPKATGDHAT